MKVSIIHGQSHREFSYHAGRMLVDKLQNAEVIGEFFLPKDLPEFCIGCYTCMNIDETHCPHNKYLEPITKAMDASDLLIFTTPVYCMHTTGSMKTLLDHYFTWWMSHRPKENMLYKKAVIIALGAGVGMKSATKDIKVSLQYWGISNIQTCCQRSMASHWIDVKKEIADELDKKLTKIALNLNKRKHANVSLRTKIIFMAMRMMNKKNWSACEQDKVYWMQKGWLGNVRPWKRYE